MAGTAAPRRRPKRRGRPPGTVGLTQERRRTILAYIEAGAWDYIAAEAAGIDVRTFHDWLAHGEGRHPTRTSTPALASFAKEVRQAKARARAAREVVVAGKNPEFWLTHAARSKPGREGWTDPVEDVAAASRAAGVTFEPDPQEAAEILRILLSAGAISLDEQADPPAPSDEAEGDEVDG